MYLVWLILHQHKICPLFFFPHPIILIILIIMVALTADGFLQLGSISILNDSNLQFLTTTLKFQVSSFGISREEKSSTFLYRSRSSTGQSSCLLSSRLQVQILPGSRVLLFFLNPIVFQVLGLTRYQQHWGTQRGPLFTLS